MKEAIESAQVLVLCVVSQNMYLLDTIARGMKLLTINHIAPKNIVSHLRRKDRHPIRQEPGEK